MVVVVIRPSRSPTSHCLSVVCLHVCLDVCSHADCELEVESSGPSTVWGPVNACSVDLKSQLNLLGTANTADVCGYTLQRACWARLPVKLHHCLFYQNI